MPFDATDPDTKAAIDKIKIDLATQAEADAAGLKAKVEELIASNKKLKKGQEIDPAEVERLEADVDKLRTDLAAANKTAKDATATADKATKALTAEQGVTHRLIAENGLVAELTKVGVTDPAYLDATKAMLLGQVKVVADGDERKALYGDKPLADAIKEWAGSDVGKRFVAAPNNNGGGAPGGKGGEGAGKTMARPAFDALDAPNRMAFIKEGGQLTEATA